jgi:hypothetical protein
MSCENKQTIFYDDKCPIYKCTNIVHENVEISEKPAKLITSMMSAKLETSNIHVIKALAHVM